MDKAYQRISRIENFFSILLTKARVTDNLCIGNLPAAIDSGWKTMVLVDVISPRDLDSHAEGTVNVFLYAKSTDSKGTKPVKVLNKMEEILDKTINENYDPHYVLRTNWRDADYDKTRNYYYNVVNIGITIK